MWDEDLPVHIYHRIHFPDLSGRVTGRSTPKTERCGTLNGLRSPGSS